MCYPLTNHPFSNVFPFKKFSPYLNVTILLLTDIRRPTFLENTCECLKTMNSIQIE